jgi:dihydrofolate reductase
MGRLINSLNVSLDGRRLYELMAAYWPTAELDPRATDPMREFARIWNATPTFVFSTSLSSVGWNSRPVAGDVETRPAEIRSEFRGDLDVGGATLASAIIECGFVDEYRLLVHPVILGSGTPLFPPLEAPIALGSSRPARSIPVSSTSGTGRRSSGASPPAGDGRLSVTQRPRRDAARRWRPGPARARSRAGACPLDSHSHP